MLRVDLIKAGQPEFSLSGIQRQIEKAAQLCIAQVQVTVNEEYEDSYMAVLFKNITKCKDIANKVSEHLKAADLTV